MGNNHKSKPKITIIIPAYNTEMYISKCLESIINQTMPEIEIIIINDGSTDSTAIILSRFQQKDSRIKVITQKNKKQGAARNKGLDMAHGEFITFVDSDDWIEPDYLEKLYNSAKKYRVNTAAACMTRDYPNQIKNHLHFDYEREYFGENEVISVIKGHFETAGKLYKFEPIKDLRFAENVYYEDAGYTIRALYTEKSLVTVPNAVYHYVSNPNSTIKSRLDDKHRQDKILTSLDFINFAEQKNLKVPEKTILKEQHLFYKIKHFKYRKDFYIFGLKVFSVNKNFNTAKI